MELLVKHAVRPQDLHFLFTLDADDPRAEGNLSVIGDLLPVDSRTIVIGRSDGKIDAVNRDMLLYAPKDWQTVIVASDDMHATPEWDHWVIEGMRKFYPTGDGCISFSDGKQDRLCTIPCMGYPYWKRLGYIYNPVYKSVFVDNEQMELAEQLGRMTHIAHVLFHHDHPAWNGMTPDALYRKNESPEIWAHDEAIYRKRKAAGFP